MKPDAAVSPGRVKGAVLEKEFHQAALPKANGEIFGITFAPPELSVKTQSGRTERVSTFELKTVLPDWMARREELGIPVPPRCEIGVRDNLPAVTFFDQGGQELGTFALRLQGNLTKLAQFLNSYAQNGSHAKEANVPAASSAPAAPPAVAAPPIASSPAPSAAEEVAALPPLPALGNVASPQAGPTTRPELLSLGQVWRSQSGTERTILAFEIAEGQPMVRVERNAAGAISEEVFPRAQFEELATSNTLELVR